MPLYDHHQHANHYRRGRSRWAGFAASVLVLGLAAFAGISCMGGAHDDGRMAVNRSDCVSCHKTEFLTATAPPHVNAFPTTCGDCHTNDVWKPAKDFHHERFFPLQGSHASVACTACHTKGFKQRDTPKDCVGCHRKDYDASTFPKHSTFALTCGDCHGTSGWKPAKGGDHDKFFPLDGAHAQATCVQCHTKGYGPGDTPTDCVGCHRKDYDTNPFPGHSSFSTSCKDCHSTAAWKPGTIPNHDQFFKLEGAHTQVACASCHTKGYAAGQTPTDCVGCHRKDYDSSPFPGHSTFSTTCTDCHSTAAWKPGTFPNHDQFFKLEGAHTQVMCASCHTKGYAAGQTPKDCVGCHRKDYDSSPYPGHSAFPTTCTDCHTTAAWKPASGGIHPETNFPITTGSHKVVACMDCHNASLGVNSKANTDCVGCHTGKHTRMSMDAKHQGVSKYPTGAAPPNFCLDCHRKG